MQDMEEKQMNPKECPDYEYCNSNTCGNDISKCCVECELNETYCFEICDFANLILKEKKNES